MIRLLRIPLAVHMPLSSVVRGEQLEVYTLTQPSVVEDTKPLPLLTGPGLAEDAAGFEAAAGRVAPRGRAAASPRGVPNLPDNLGLAANLGVADSLSAGTCGVSTAASGCWWAAACCVLSLVSLPSGEMLQERGRGSSHPSLDYRSFV